MSTKTSIKRIALVAVSALGFGLLSVMPANAASVGGDDIAVTDANETVAVGTATSSTFTIDLNANLANGDSIVVTPVLTSKPAGSTITIIKKSSASTSGADGSEILNNTGEAFDNTTGAAADSTSVYTLSATGAHTDDGATVAGTVGFTPDIPGVYVVTLTMAAAAGGTPAADTATYTVLATASNATSTGTASMTASWNCTVVQAGEGCVNASGAYTNPILTATMPSGVFAANATDLKVKVTRTADSNVPVNSILDATAPLLTTYSSTTSALTLTLDVDGTGLWDTAGLYEFLVFADADLNGDYTSGERFVTTSLRLAGAPTTYSVSVSPSSAAVGDTVIVDVTFSDGTYPTATADTDGIDITASFLTGDKELINSDALGLTGKRRSVMVVAAGTTAGAKTLEFTDAAGIFTSAVEKEATLTVNVETAATKFAYVAADGIKVTSAVDVELEAGDATGALTVDLAKTTVYYTATTTAGEQVKVTTAPNASTVSTTISTSGVRFYTALADGTVTFPVTMSTATAGKGYTVTVEAGGTDFAYTVTYADPGAAWTKLPGSAITLKEGGSQSWTVILKDVFGRALASKAVTATVSGRNTATFSGTTDASGVFTFTTTDTDTRSLDDADTDTVTLTYNYTNVAGTASSATGGTITITYAADAITASTITIAESDADNSISIDQVEQVAGSPATASLLTYTASVKDANGAAVDDGAICSWSADADTKFYLGSTYSVTADGQCSATIYRQLAGYAILTVTAGGITASNGNVQWVNDGGDTAADGTGAQNAHDGRTVTVSAAQSVVGGSAATVVATVKDRWGNPVSGVLVTWSYTGVGRPVSGADASVGTDANGTAQYQVTALSSETGAMTVTATISGGQTADLAGYVSGTSVSGVTAGNTKASSTVTFTKDTSVSTADALLELAKAIGTGKDVEAAADAALEAIDAANAATDAANLAAEAADAATVAAEEARDAADAATAAVEELATQVATLMSALKAQLTTLANTVAKIAKKVKA